MNVLIQPGKLTGTVTVPPSKSHAHRLLLAAALAGAPDCVDVAPTSQDLQATQEALTILIQALAQRDTTPADTLVLNCRESGSTLRFLLPVACALGCATTYIFERQGRLPQRPLSPLQEEMERHGCRFSEDAQGRLAVSGQLTGGDFHIAGNVSSQFITGLLFALPLTAEGGSIILEGPLASRSYVDMTLAVLQSFGIVVRQTATGFVVPGQQVYQPLEIPQSPEGDWSNGAFFLVAQALGNELEVQGLPNNSLQGDQVITSIIQSMKELKRVTDLLAQARKEGRPLFYKERLAQKNLFDRLPSYLKARAGCLWVDVDQFPDLVPLLALLSWGSGVPLKVMNGQRLRMKESDRIAAVVALLETLEAPVEETPDGFILSPSSPAPGYGDLSLDREDLSPEAVETDNALPPEDTSAPSLDALVVNGADDHRIIMAAALATTVMDRSLLIQGAQAVSKSWPTFFEELSALGGQISYIED